MTVSVLAVGVRNPDVTLEDDIFDMLLYNEPAVRGAASLLGPLAGYIQA